MAWANSQSASYLARVLGAPGQQFGNPDLEELWQLQDAAARLRTDFFVAPLTSLPIAIVLFGAWPAVQRVEVVVFAVAFLLPSTLVPVFILTDRKAFMQNRSRMLLCIRLTRQLVGMTVTVLSKSYDWMRIPANASSNVIVRNLLLRPSTSLLYAFCFQLPVHLHWWSHLAGVVGLLAMDRPCAVECASPSLAAMYAQVAGACSRAVAWLLPMAPASDAGGAAPWEPVPACAAVHYWLILCLGYALPLVVVSAGEASSRAHFLQQLGLPSEPRCGWKLDVIASLALTALTSALFWQLLELLVQLNPG